MLGIAMGVARISFDDFMRLTPDELDAVLSSNRELRELESRENWERTRIQTAYTIQPHIKKPLSPQQLIPLKWDQQPQKEAVLNRDEHRKRFERLIANGQK